ncbi:MAG: hypothetical protein ACLQG3_19365 [Terracidiphilus sp.]
MIDSALELYLADESQRGIEDSSKVKRLLRRLGDTIGMPHRFLLHFNGYSGSRIAVPRNHCC